MDELTEKRECQHTRCICLSSTCDDRICESELADIGLVDIKTMIPNSYTDLAIYWSNTKCSGGSRVFEEKCEWEIFLYTLDEFLWRYAITSVNLQNFFS